MEYIARLEAYNIENESKFTRDFLIKEIEKSIANQSNNKKLERRLEKQKSQIRRGYISFIQREIGNRTRVLESLLEKPDFSNLPSPYWIGFKIHFTLLTPWYSKDDKVFHLLDNPVRKEHIFGVPYMPASLWKGLIRWTCRMKSGLKEHLKAYDGRMDDWKDPDWILYLFGNERGAEEFNEGVLTFYPTWFNSIGFEVINPHNRERRAGTQPIYYEVVPPETKGVLSILYAPWPGNKYSKTLDEKEVLKNLIEAIDDLLRIYGFSAKRTVGWGTAKIDKWTAYKKGEPKIEVSDKKQFIKELLRD